MRIIEICALLTVAILAVLGFALLMGHHAKAETSLVWDDKWDLWARIAIANGSIVPPRKP